jgi:hypothetical protein
MYTRFFIFLIDIIHFLVQFQFQKLYNFKFHKIFLHLYLGASSTRPN